MSDTGRVAAFGGVLAVVFVAALGLGRLIGPVGPAGPAPAGATHGTTQQSDPMHVQR